MVDGILTIGWCGDSRAVLGRKAKGSKQWTAFELSHDHKPTNPREHKRILQLGGMVGRSLKEAQSGKAYQRAGGCVEINQGVRLSRHRGHLRGPNSATTSLWYTRMRGASSASLRPQQTPS